MYTSVNAELKASAEPTDHKRALAFLPLAPAQHLSVEIPKKIWKKSNFWGAKKKVRKRASDKPTNHKQVLATAPTPLRRKRRKRTEEI